MITDNASFQAAQTRRAAALADLPVIEEQMQNLKWRESLNRTGEIEFTSPDEELRLQINEGSGYWAILRADKHGNYLSVAEGEGYRDFKYALFIQQIRGADFLNEELLARLKQALRYLEHPNVQAIGFARPAECCAADCQLAIEHAEQSKTVPAWIFADLLEAKFPWIGSDAPLSISDVIQGVVDLHAELRKAARS